MNLSNQQKIKFLRIRNFFLRTFPSLADVGETLQFLRSVKKIRTFGWVGSPPYLVKRAMLKAEAIRIGAVTFVETGTYMGDTPWSLRNTCKFLISIEVQPILADIARKRFRNTPQVKIVTGDSAVELKETVPKVEGPCLFWLDGHYSAGMTGRGSKDCPIYEELEAIAGFGESPFSIMIDDARCFGTDAAYPSLKDLEVAAQAHFPKHHFAVWNDVIHITPTRYENPLSQSISPA